jgi:hypothetical protein
VLFDTHRRVSVLGGREGMRRSLGSVYSGLVTQVQCTSPRVVSA